PRRTPPPLPTRRSSDLAGINNGGGEYREYIWPVMVLFGIGIILSIWNFIKTIARRSNKEIYVSNWYIISAMMFLLVIAVVAYWPERKSTRLNSSHVKSS